MAESKQTPKRAGQTRTQTQTHVAQPTTGPLTVEEERVVRMVHGLSEGDDYELKFVDSVDEEVNARLKLMEAVLLAQMHQKGPMTVERAMTPHEKILSHLKTLKDEE